MAPTKSEALRRVVLDAALAISSNTGPDALSLREVAREAGVSHQAPYHHFGDRAGIFAAVAEEGFNKLANSLEHSQEFGAISMCEAYVHFALQNKGHFRVMFRSDLCDVDNYPDASFQANRAFEILLSEARSILGVDATEDRAILQATFMWSVAHGLATLLLDGPLENKLGAQEDVGAFVRNVTQIAMTNVHA